MAPGCNPDDPVLEIALPREPFPALVEQRRETFGDVAETDEREIRARVGHGHSLRHTWHEYFRSGCLCALVADCYPVRADT